MPTKHRRMRLSPEELRFLRQWMWDEVHYLEGVGPAKRLQVEHGVPPADLALLIAAAIPDPADQAAAIRSAPTEPPSWPWSEETWQARLAEARAVLADRGSGVPISRPPLA